jgi:hypothetical protein
MKIRSKTRKRHERAGRTVPTSAKNNGAVGRTGVKESRERSAGSRMPTSNRGKRRDRRGQPNRQEPGVAETLAHAEHSAESPVADDPLAVAKRRMAEVRPTELEQLDAVLPKLKRILSRTLSRGTGLPDEQRRPLLSVLAGDALALLHRHELVVEAMTFHERMRGAKELPAIRAAKRRFRDALSALRDEGADAALVTSFEHLAH